MQLTSSAFGNGEPIPDEYGYTERNVNPPLTIADVPEGAESLALIVDDPDAIAPAGKIWDHWVVWNIPPGTEAIPEDWDPGHDGAMEGRNDYGERGYGGPNPPDGRHTYRFELSALNTTVDLRSSADADDLRAAIDGHVLDQALLEGTYAP